MNQGALTIKTKKYIVRLMQDGEYIWCRDLASAVMYHALGWEHIRAVNYEKQYAKKEKNNDNNI